MPGFFTADEKRPAGFTDSWDPSLPLPRAKHEALVQALVHGEGSFRGACRQAEVDDALARRWMKGTSPLGRAISAREAYVRQKAAKTVSLCVPSKLQLVHDANARLEQHRKNSPEITKAEVDLVQTIYRIVDELGDPAGNGVVTVQGHSLTSGHQDAVAYLTGGEVMDDDDEEPVPDSGAAVDLFEDDGGPAGPEVLDDAV